MKLTLSQQKAINYFREYTKTRQESAREDIEHVLKMSDLTWEEYQQALNSIRKYARIALHFHPDRPGPDMKTVAESLLESGIYKSQFETLISNGSVSAFPGGARDVWENTLFHGAYNLEGTTIDQRPKYGSLDLMLHSDGPSPRFGSCYFLLKPEVSARATFTYLDSHQNPDEKGTIDEFDDIMRGLLNECFSRSFAIGEHDIRPAELIRHFLQNLQQPYTNPATKLVRRNLDHYIEAQIHGSISLESDVEILVIDPAFKATDMGEIFQEICQRYHIDLYTHPGFRLKPEEVPRDFRGPTMPSLAKRISDNNHVDVSHIGLASLDLKTNPERWADRGTYKEVLQELKLLWHVLVKYGKST